MSRLFVVAALLVAVAVASSDIDVKFEADVNLTDAADSFGFRYQKSLFVDIPDLIAKLIGIPGSVFLWSSASVNVNGDSEKQIADGNAMVSLALPPSKYTFPFAVLAYGEGKSAVKFKLDINNILYGTSYASTFKGAMVSMAALSLEEYTSEGKYVDNSRILLVKSCDPEEVDKDGVKGMTCKQKFDDTSVITTFLTSEKAGILKYGETPVSPRSLEMIIEVDNFKLSNKKNHVRLNLGLVSASGDVDVDGNVKYIEEDGEKVYVAASGYAVVGNERTEVDVSVESGALSKDESIIKAFNAVMKLSLGSKYDASIAHVDFPAGETSFIYDPAAGSGSVVYEAGASTIALSALAVLICALLLLL